MRKFKWIKQLICDMITNPTMSASPNAMSARVSASRWLMRARFLACLCLLKFTPSFAIVLSVQEFGADGSDDIADASAIQKAINAAGEGDVVCISSGTYLIDIPLNAKSGIMIKGSGVRETTLRYTGTIADGMIKLQNIIGVDLCDFTIDGKGNDHLVYGVVAYQGSGHHMHHLVIRDMEAVTPSGPVAIRLGGSTSSRVGTTGCVIENNLIENIGINSEWGGGIRCSWGSSRNAIRENNISKTGRGGIFANDGSTDLIITSNTISESGLFTACLGIEIWNECDRTLIEDNTLDHWLSVDRSDFCAVRRNTVSGTTDERIAYIGLEAAGASNAVFTNNVVLQGQRVGISISSAPSKNYIYWAGNRIESMIQWGAQLQGDAGGARYQYFYNNEFIGTKSADPRASYPDSAGQGFRFNQNAWHITLDSNRIENNGRTGIQFSNNINQISIINNKIVGNAGAGISVCPETITEIEIAGNYVQGNAGNTIPASRGYENERPTALFEAPSYVVSGEPVLFMNSSMDPDGAISYCLWDFDDGLPSAERSPMRIYESPGSYNVSLVVWDNEGRGHRTTRTLNVIEKLPQITALPGQSISWGVDGSLFPDDAEFTWELSVDGVTWSPVFEGYPYAGVATSELTLHEASEHMGGLQYRYTMRSVAGILTDETTLVVNASPLAAPSALVVDAGSGEIYVTDAANHVVYKISSDEKKIAVVAGSVGTAGSFPGMGAEARFNSPAGIAINETIGRLIVADTGNHDLRKLAADGVSDWFPDSSAHLDTLFRKPSGVAADDKGNTYVADAGNHVIRMITPDGAVRTMAGMMGISGTSDGNALTEARFNNPCGIAVVDGCVYVADTGNHSIRLITSGEPRQVLTLAGEPGAAGCADGNVLTEGRFRFPEDLVIDGDKMYIADTGNSLIRKIDGNRISTLAGQRGDNSKVPAPLAGIPGFRDGSGACALLRNPRGIAMGGDGALYVADTGNSAIRKILDDAQATVVTLVPVSSGGGGDIPTPPKNDSQSEGKGGGGGALSLSYLVAFLILEAAWAWRLRK
jgi:PKD repeat protein